MPRSRADVVVDWEKLGAAFRANPTALTGLDPLLLELETLQAEIRSLGIQQDAQQAAVQQTTKEIEDRVKRGTLLATRLRNGVKAFYGTRTEKVIEFGIRPFRKPSRAPKAFFVEEEPQPAPREVAAEPGRQST